MTREEMDRRIMETGDQKEKETRRGEYQWCRPSLKLEQSHWEGGHVCVDPWPLQG